MHWETGVVGRSASGGSSGSGRADELDGAYLEQFIHCSRPLSLADHDADAVNADSTCHLKSVAGSSPEVHAKPRGRLADPGERGDSTVHIVSISVGKLVRDAGRRGEGSRADCLFPAVSLLGYNCRAETNSPAHYIVVIGTPVDRKRHLAATRCSTARRLPPASRPRRKQA